MEKNTSSQNWRTPPAKIKDSEIAREYAADVVVIGLGNAGAPAVRAAAEAGASVIGIEKMKEEKYWVFGRDVGHINSDFLASRGIPRVDPVEFFNEWMRRSGNRANPKLVMQFCRKSGEAFNWYTDMLTQQQLDSDMAALALFGMLNWVYMWYNPCRHRDLRKLEEQLSGIFISGIRPR